MKITPRSEVRSIINEVSTLRSVGVREILSRERGRRVSFARFEVWHRMRQIRLSDGRSRYSLPKIGEVFGRHHTTILNGIVRYQQYCGENVRTLLDAGGEQTENLSGEVTRERQLHPEHFETWSV